ncbi:MAG: hypothetical protein LBP89_10070 [Helicobacteraceae bacterium]|jgi:hypothetical protein|nr:hypothetical protein [Helicobacteraceae bacterium]
MDYEAKAEQTLRDCYLVYKANGYWMQAKGGNVFDREKLFKVSFPATKILACARNICNARKRKAMLAKERVF